VHELLLQVGLRPEQAEQYPHEFSGGQRQRVALAAALASRPKLIVLDEPVSALDVSIRAQMMNLLKDIQAQDNVAYLLVAHDLATVRHMADHTVVMYLGKIVEKAPTEALFADVRHPYTRALFSAVLVAWPGRHEEEIELRGEVPSPLNPPSGCRFHTRCPYVMPRCSQQEPALREVSPGHAVACHLFDDA
jgi:oligopeptide/dipeptide ABC transporter ATP-binding protein